jgi:hypothetical protein
MKLEIHIYSDKRNREEYVFTIFDTNLVFVRYSKQNLPPRARAWRIDMSTIWDRYNKRDSRGPEPEFTEEVKELAYKEFCKRVKVLTWKQWKGEK